MGGKATGTPLTAQQPYTNLPDQWGEDPSSILSQTNAFSQPAGTLSSPGSTSRSGNIRPGLLCHVLHKARPPSHDPHENCLCSGLEMSSPLSRNERNAIILFFLSFFLSLGRGCVGNAQRTHPSPTHLAIVWSKVPAGCSTPFPPQVAAWCPVCPGFLACFSLGPASHGDPPLPMRPDIVDKECLSSRIPVREQRRRRRDDVLDV